MKVISKLWAWKLFLWMLKYWDAALKQQDVQVETLQSGSTEKKRRWSEEEVQPQAWE